MRILLDTHIFLWYITGNSQLPPKFLAAILDTSNEVFLSTASVWETVIKYQQGKLQLPESPEKYLPEQRAAHGIATLAIDESTMTFLAALPALHRDPFDRVLVAQAMQHGLILATVDAALFGYPAKLLPA